MSIEDTINKARVGWKAFQCYPCSKFERRIIAELSEPPEEVVRYTNTHRKELEGIFGTADSPSIKLVYHGTGTMRYGGQKYLDKSLLEVTPVLEAILANGLLPSYDPWMPGLPVQTVSLTQNFMYAAWYAEKNSYDPWDWYYGEENSWFYFYLADTIKAELSKPDSISGSRLYYLFNKYQEIKHVKRNALVSKKYYGDPLQGWLRSITQSAESQNSKIELLRLKTDIRNNVGCILVYEESDLIYFPMLVGGAHELRTDRPVTRKPLVVFAPLATVTSLSELCLPYKIPVLAVEAAMYYQAKTFPFNYHTKRTS